MKRSLLALFAAIFLQFIPVVNLPFLWFTALFHELGHGLVTMLTGGQVHQLVLYGNGSGRCFSSGGWPVLIAFAGYPAASLCGLLLWQGAKRASAYRWLCPLLVAALLSVTFLWVRDWLTILLISVLLLVVAMLWRVAAKGQWLWALMAATLLVNALLSPLQLLGYAGGDGHLLYELTAIPSFIFVMIWVFIGLSTVVWIVTRR
ncbi:M50 family metallopeptidase [Gallaecimonas mangrovi]|uniref:M50 family metallopeptidase n=1 Tax=Gallaecimonas mangrovi TaxID=2291597 RepID=UPI001868A6C2|nr:M50 family metallopeptidase [Gallaecimonas mangrovi]